jgi:hypothetical protein
VTRVEEKHQDHNRQLSATLEHHGQAGGDFTVTAAIDPGATYEVTWNGQPVDLRTLPWCVGDDVG